MESVLKSLLKNAEEHEKRQNDKKVIDSKGGSDGESNGLWGSHLVSGIYLLSRTNDVRLIGSSKSS